jgi:tRNA threonylcarbamoyladenosine biosynthesis protein TsaB
MILLALDTCDARGSVALLRDQDTLSVAPHNTAEDYSIWLLPAVDEILGAVGLKMADVDTYAVAAGPGSFTGVRVGLTTVKAWAEVYRRPIISISRLEVLATQATAAEPLVAALTDAHRQQVFGALYRRNVGKLQRVEEEMVIAPDKFVIWAGEKADGDGIHWISTDPHCLTQTEAWARRREMRMSETVEAANPILAPAIGRLGYQFALENRLTDALSLDANYLRRSDAEILWKGGPQQT